MMHCNRRWALAEIESPETLAKLLVERTWTLCSGFTVKGHPAYLFLNDATSEDGALVIAIVKHQPDTYVQIESVTFSWCSEASALQYIQDALAGQYDGNDFARPVSPGLMPLGNIVAATFRVRDTHPRNDRSDLPHVTCWHGAFKVPPVTNRHLTEAYARRKMPPLCLRAKRSPPARTPNP